MRFRDKGFTLIELMVSVAMLAILIAIAVPSFTGIIAKTKADSDVSELYRALNYSRSEAINRGVAVRVMPVTNGQWAGALNVQIGSVATLATTLRTAPAMTTAVAVTATSSAGAASYIEFNNLGALNFPLASVTIGYTRASQVRTLGVCLNGRVIVGAACAQ